MGGRWAPGAPGVVAVLSVSPDSLAARLGLGVQDLATGKAGEGHPGSLCSYTFLWLHSDLKIRGLI